jgi:hypothetical protein
MASMNRLRVGWSGWAGQPGLSTFFMADGRLDVTPIKTFLTAMAAFVPSGVTFTIPALGDKITDIDGSLSGAWVGTGGGTVVGTGGSVPYAGSAGLCVDWKTTTISNRRRIQGRTFFVPGASGIYQNDGSILESVRSTVLAAATTLIGSMGTDFLVWSRPVVAPVPNPPAGTPGHVEPRDGTSGPVVAAFVPDLAVVLRSRRV